MCLPLTVPSGSSIAVPVPLTTQPTAAPVAACWQQPAGQGKSVGFRQSIQHINSCRQRSQHSRSSPETATAVSEPELGELLATASLASAARAIAFSVRNRRAAAAGCQQATGAARGLRWPHLFALALRWPNRFRSRPAGLVSHLTLMFLRAAPSVVTRRSHARVPGNGRVRKGRSAGLVSPQITCMICHKLWRGMQQKQSSSRKHRSPQWARKNMH